MKTKVVYVFLLILMAFCTNSKKNGQLPLKFETAQSDTVEFQKQIENFDCVFKSIKKELYDSVKLYQTDGIDFSDITSGIERKYKECNNDIEKTLMGYELAKNYFLCFRNSNKISYKQKADSLFYSFVCFNDGKMASIYLKLDINKVQFIETKWENLPEQDKETILFYGLLRGFDNGLPEILKNIE